MKDLLPSPDGPGADSLAKPDAIGPQSDGKKGWQVSQGIMEHWGGVSIKQISRRLNEHWIVEVKGERLVLRGYPPTPLGDIAYELEVLRRLRKEGWPVPSLAEEPIHVDGRTWCLFTMLRGECRPATAGTMESRTRGHLLAQLHQTTSCLVDMGQRKGFSRSDLFLNDPELITALRAYEKIRPREGHVLRWHCDWATAAFASINTRNSETIVLHGDFSRWNLLFEGERLTGILDFEATHLNYRVADFALSWRGEQDEVIQGYQEVFPLSELDWQLLVPCYWAWLFFGIGNEIQAMLAGKAPVHGFDWQVGHLLRRSPMLAEKMPQYSR
jgi:aminoglycoside phosphotransferase (APT) family kinase protein